MTIGASPVPVLIILGIYMAVYLSMGLSSSDTCGNELPNCGLDSAPTTTQPDDSIFDILTSIIASVWEVVLLIGKGLTFNVPGVPAFIRIPIAIALVSSLSWSIATLIRGN